MASKKKKDTDAEGQAVEKFLRQSREAETERGVDVVEWICETVAEKDFKAADAREGKVAFGQGGVALAATAEQGRTGELTVAQDAVAVAEKEATQRYDLSEGYSTAYDDAFRTILTDCTRLILPVVNEMFGTSYPMEAEVRLYPNERFLRGKDGKELKTIADSYIAVVGDEGVEHSYNIECQSTKDGSMLLRVFEYAVQIGLDNTWLIYGAEVGAAGEKSAQKGNEKADVITGEKNGRKGGAKEGNILHGGGVKEKAHPVLEVRLPASGILYLRSTKNTPNTMTVRMMLPDGNTAEYDVVILKTKSYSLREIAKKKLYFLIPFHLFKYESEFGKKERDGSAKEYFEKVSQDALSTLQEGHEKGDIDLYEVQALREMYLRVTEQLAMSHQDIQEGVKKTMGGQVLNYEAKDIRNQALAEGIGIGRAEGIGIGRAEGYSDMADALRHIGIAESQIEEAMKYVDSKE